MYFFYLRLLWTLLLCSLLSPLMGQAGTQELKRRDLEELAAVQSLMTLQRFDDASQRLAKLVKKYPEVAELRYLDGEIDQYEHRYAEAATAITKGIALDGGSSARAYRRLGDVCTQAGDYAAALGHYETYRAKVGEGGRASSIATADKLVAQARTVAELAANPYPFAPAPLGPGVNTPESLEYFPNLSVDGQQLIFTRRVNRQQEDFYQSRRQADGQWGKATPLTGVNTELNEGAQTITADGNYLVFTGCGRRDGAGGCDLYASTRVGDRWTDAVNLGPGINTRSSESQPSLSQDGSLLFFASNREGGLGQDDIYVVGRRADGSWGRPVNLGPTVNTPSNDRYPFWAADGKTLYFTSSGRPGMGGADLFKTSVNAANQWQKPTNLGYPINTPGEETNLFIALDGRTAYFSKGVGNDIDIYTFDLPGKLRPAPATYVQVSVVDDQTGQPLEASVRLQPQKPGGIVSARSTDASGHYLTVLPIGLDYGFSVEKSGYVFYSDRFSLTDTFSVTEPFRLQIRLQPVKEVASSETAEADGAIVLRNVFFETASDALIGLSTEELDRLATLLREQPAVSVEIAGHTDDVGTEAANQTLSERRARRVKAYLETQGIAAERITAVGYGESRPVATNATEAGRASNRRTTFRLVF
ncbi:Peptidoglycan-associated lipoprotein [Neolewinella maritima]|uniref:Peptidoglycan-associated lipoprotein n=1 Tax=Neolewinella maritima TaxID=1383882 RepID=A0ABM9B0H1_9BACT|nr:OmpA family protein [Neolewinella maritima]CAH1000587.1 Peptidoglycan-associated lipoprotein [Neolewinella maritima]